MSTITRYDLVRKDEVSSCFMSTGKGVGCCRVESIVSVDDRGQIVLPKEIRDRANIGAGDKLALVSWERDERVCCIFLIKAEDFAGMVKNLLGPMMKEIVKK